MFPSPPPWSAIHPLLVHFPIGLLLTAPLLIIMALLLRRSARAFTGAAWVLTLAGTIWAFLAVSSGEAAADLVTESGPAERVLSDHEELAELARTLFAVLTGLWGLALIAPRLLRRRPWRRRSLLIINVVVLVLYVGPALVLMQVGHLGGQLVHAHGITAEWPGDAPPAAQADGEHEDEGHEEQDD